MGTAQAKSTSGDALARTPIPWRTCSSVEHDAAACVDRIEDDEAGRLPTVSVIVYVLGKPLSKIPLLFLFYFRAGLRVTSPPFPSFSLLRLVERLKERKEKER